MTAIKNVIFDAFKPEKKQRLCEPLFIRLAEHRKRLVIEKRF